jgi:hypothetical protein
MKYVNGRLSELVTFCLETAFYNWFLRNDKKRDGSDRTTRKKK